MTDAPKPRGPMYDLEAALARAETAERERDANFQAFSTIKADLERANEEHGKAFLTLRTERDAAVARAEKAEASIGTTEDKEVWRLAFVGCKENETTMRLERDQARAQVEILRGALTAAADELGVIASANKSDRSLQQASVAARKALSLPAHAHLAEVRARESESMAGYLRLLREQSDAGEMFTYDVAIETLLLRAARIRGGGE